MGDPQGCGTASRESQYLLCGVGNVSRVLEAKGITGWANLGLS